MNENTNMRQMSLPLDAAEAITVNPGMSEMQIKELAWRIKSRQSAKAWAKRYPKRRLAHADVCRAIKNGTLVRPNVCNRCGTETYTVAHHADYRKPLDVEWLCDSCHARHHWELRKKRSKSKK